MLHTHSFGIDLLIIGGPANVSHLMNWRKCIFGRSCNMLCIVRVRSFRAGADYLGFLSGVLYIVQL